MCVYTHMYMYIHTCMCVYIMHVYICIFIYTYTYNGILFSPKKEGSYAICNDMDGPSDHYARKVKSGII